MMRIKLLFICFFSFLTIFLLGKESTPKKIAVCILAEEESSPVQSLIESGRRYFCRLHDVHYYIASHEPLEMDGEDIEWLPMNIGRKDRKHFKLYEALQGAKKVLESYDYLFILHANVLFVATVGDEIFGELIAVKKEISAGKSLMYSSAFYGGKPSAVLDLLKTACKHIDYTASHPNEQRFNEEMLMNRCFKERRPTRILSPSYAYPENWKLDYPRKIAVASR